jgi:Rieske Fe-S protein
VVAIVAPLLVFIYPPAGGSKKQPLAVTLDKPVTGLQEGDAVKFQAPKDSGFVMTDGGGDNAPGKIAFAGYLVKEAGGAITAFAINCSHLGCSVNFNLGGARFECPCHGSVFDVNGQVIHGPAAFPLSHLDWSEGQDPNQVLVTGLKLPGIG